MDSAERIDIYTPRIAKLASNWPLWIRPKRIDIYGMIHIAEVARMIFTAIEALTAGTLTHSPP